MPEWGDRLRALRERFGLSQRQLAELFDVSQTTIRRPKWTECWEKLVRFLEEEPNLAMSLLSERLRERTSRPWPERFAALRQKIGINLQELAELLSVTPTTTWDWNSGRHEPQGCEAVIFWILESYSDIEPTSWPSILMLPPGDVITPERIKMLRHTLMLRQRDLANLMHSPFGTISQKEYGAWHPGWCQNLLLKLIEAMPGPAIELIERIPWTTTEVSAEKATEVREKTGLSQVQLSRIFRCDLSTIVRLEREGIRERGCVALVYALLDNYHEEFLGLVKILYEMESGRPYRERT